MICPRFIHNTIRKDHAMLVAPCRFGRTSIMKKIEKTPGGQSPAGYMS
ncbi:hypothetical protein ASZ90_010408 [hydrocarbon metagenome]|uniref:Uncharacterized protein n=1 Tax=hydrocarbon metagenome TaxID=938273 RepID=A0A0W8FGK2_9ZZZZ